MLKIKEVLRLRHASGLSIRQISVATNASVGSVQSLLKRAARANLSWPLPDELSEPELVARLYHRGSGNSSGGYALPEWPYIHQQLKRMRIPK